MTDNEPKVLKLKINPPIEIRFEPHQDITPLEAAYIGQFYALAASHHMRPGDFDGWSLIERHFKVIER